MIFRILLDEHLVIGKEDARGGCSSLEENIILIVQQKNTNVPSGGIATDVDSALFAAAHDHTVRYALVAVH
jgi:hypothetical protein